jgi:hypothetical protein
MSTDKVENKDKVEQKVSKDELSEKQLDKATGGSDVTFEYGGLQIKYTPQKPDGSLGD